MEADELPWRNYFTQRGIYKTLMVRCTINAVLLRKPHTKHHQCVVGGCVAPDQTNVPFVRRQRISSRRRPSTRGATAPQRAQLVNLVVGCWRPAWRAQGGARHDLESIAYLHYGNGSTRTKGLSITSLFRQLFSVESL